MNVRILIALMAWVGVSMPITLPAAEVSQNLTTAPQKVEYAANRGSLHMGTYIQSKLFASTAEEAQQLSDYFEEKIAALDDEWSVHKASPLNRVNERAGEAVEISSEMAEVIKEALSIAEETDGAFEPLIGPVVNLWKIGFGGEHKPNDADVEKALNAVDRSRVEVWNVDDRHFVRIGSDQSIDLGAMAKGYIGTRLAEKLRKKGLIRGILDLGGNVVVVGERAPGIPWHVGIQQPDQTRGGYFAVVSAHDESIITSGAYERYFEEDGKRYSHIIDPKTGRPAVTDISSVTVVSKNGGRADALCTAFFVMGWEKTCDFLKQHSEIRAILLHADMQRALVTRSAAPFVTKTDSSVKLTILD